MRKAVKGQWQSVVFVDLDHTVMEGSFTFAVYQVACSGIANKSKLPVEKVRLRVKQENLRRQRENFPATVAMDWDDIVCTVAETLGVKLEVKVSELVSFYAKSHSRILDDAAQVLQQLASPYRAIVAATNGLNKYQLPVLDALKLTPLFNYVLTPDPSDRLKDHIDFYGEWPHITDLQIIVGDDYNYDIQAPQKLGFKTIWKSNGKDSKKRSIEPFVKPLEPDIADKQSSCPDETIDSLQELPMAVKRLESQALQIPEWNGRVPECSSTSPMPFARNAIALHTHA